MTTIRKSHSFKINEERLFKKNSSRHHYIPEFLTKGFTNENGKVFVFDKIQDEVLAKQKAPRSIFFEFDRNTVEVTNEISSSFIEDEFYSRIDDNGSQAIIQFRDENLKSIEFTIENTGHLLFFLIALFWRIPATDYAANDVIDKTLNASSDIDVEGLQTDPFFRKTERLMLVKHMSEEMKRIGGQGKVICNIHQPANAEFVIGDYPFLLQKTSNEFGRLFSNDYLFALSSNRIYSSTKSSIDNFSHINAALYNASIVHQSKRYICASNRETLENAIKTYRSYKDKWRENELAADAFLKYE